IAVPIGILWALVSFIRRIIALVEVKELEPVQSEETLCPQIATFTVCGALFFGAAAQFQLTSSRSIHRRPSVLILKMNFFTMRYYTGLANISSLVDKFIDKAGTIMITRLSDESTTLLQQNGLYEWIGKNYIFNKPKEAIDKALNLINVEECSYCKQHGAKLCRVYSNKTD